MTRLVPLARVVMTLGIGACGDDDDAPSRQNFANDADRICRDTEKELEKIFESADTPEEAADTIDEVIDKCREAADELADLERPEGDAGDTAERFAKGFEQELNAS